MSLRNSVFGTASMLGLAGMLSFTGCANEKPGQDSNSTNNSERSIGGIDLGLRLADGSDVETVAYVITRNGVEVTTGTMEIGANGVASTTITNLQEGSGYLVTLRAPRTRPDAGAVAPCEGSATFSVIANLTTPVQVVLQCDDTSADEGNVTINGSFNICPKITMASASPTTVSVGSAVTLAAVARDKDASDTVTYEWFTASGSFASTASASYTCAAVGAQTIGLRVTDGPTRGCTKTLATPFTINCVGGSEPVDSGAPVVDSGAPVVDSGAPVVDSGAPVVDSGAPVVDSGTPPVAALYGGPECNSCLTANCNPYMEVVPYLADCTTDECRAVFACFQSNHCSTDVTNIHNCYCGGTGTFEACQDAAFVPSGPCKGLLETGLGTTVKREIFERFYNVQYNAADGTGLFFCGAELCNDACVVNPR